MSGKAKDKNEEKKEPEKQEPVWHNDAGRGHPIERNDSGSHK